MTEEPRRSLLAHAVRGRTVPIRRGRSRLALAALVVVAVALSPACGGSQQTKAKVEKGDWGGAINVDGEPVRGGTLRVASQADPPGISPLYFITEVPDQATIKVVMQMFDQLVELRPGSLEPQPGLAERWKVSGDGLEYTFTLRKAKFSNGMPVTADDVKYSLDVLRGPKSFFLDLFKSIAAVEAVDDSTVVIRLSEPSPALLYYLAFPGASIVPAKVVEREGMEAFNRRPIGSGPFALAQWRRNQEVVLRRNEHYWRKGLPHLDEVRLLTTPDENARVLDIQSGTVNAADQVPFGQVDALGRRGDVDVLVATAAETYAVAMNSGKKPYDDVSVRQALNYATPADAINDAVFHGHAERANTELPKLKYWTDQAKPFPYDLDKARALLKQSSVPDGFTARIIIDANSQASRQVAQILQQSWKNIGIELKIEQLDDATTEDQYVNGKYELLIGAPGGGMSDVPVEDEFAQLSYLSPETHNLYTFSGETKATPYARQALKELDEERRADLFAKMHVASREDPTGIPLLYTPNAIAVSSRVHDLNYMLCGWFLLDGVWVEQ